MRAPSAIDVELRVKWDAACVLDIAAIIAALNARLSVRMVSFARLAWQLNTMAA